MRIHTISHNSTSLTPLDPPTSQTHKKSGYGPGSSVNKCKQYNFGNLHSLIKIRLYFVIALQVIQACLGRSNGIGRAT